MVIRLLILTIYFFVPAVFAADKSILVLGDSLSAGYEMSIEHGWVSLLQKRLNSEGYDYSVINASISGDTTSGAYARLENHLDKTHPVIVVVELGGNDGLRGLSLDEMYNNLAGIISSLLERNIQVLLIPIQIPPNYGQIYTTKFQEVYQRLADAYDVVLGRFLLDGIALDPELMRTDGIHPTAEAQINVLDNIWPFLKKMLDEMEVKSGS